MSRSRNITRPPRGNGKAWSNWLGREWVLEERREEAARRNRRRERDLALDEQQVAYLDGDEPANTPECVDFEVTPGYRLAGRVEDPYEEPLADWERELLGLDDEGNYSSERADAYDGGVDLDEDDRVDEACDDYDLDDLANGSNWMEACTLSEVAQAMPEGFSVIEVTRDRTSGKAAGNYRVYELARKMGIDSKHLVWALRLDGEWVRSHMSYVADPVADLYFEYRGWFQEKFGQRTTPETWAQKRERLDAEAKRYDDERAARLLAERVGTNPFRGL